MQNAFRLDNELAIITGAGRGLEASFPPAALAPCGPQGVAAGSGSCPVAIR